MNIIVFSQHLILDSMSKIAKEIPEEFTLFITPHFLFENEREYLRTLFNKSEFKTFADYLSDQEMASCDENAYEYDKHNYENYLNQIRKLKNRIIIDKVLNEYPNSNKFILSKDLGIDYNEWRKKGFKNIRGKYYYYEENSVRKTIKKILSHNSTISWLYHTIKKDKPLQHKEDEVHVAYFNNRKYVFLGNMSRIAYRFDIEFKESIQDCKSLNAGFFETKEKCTYLTTWHENSKCNIPDKNCYSVRWAQDGYLPPNYSHYDYSFKPHNVVYYCWDVIGTHLFINKGLPYEMIPFRKKLYLPTPVFPKEIKNILVVASGSGDWTALKNRSDDDIMVEAFVEMAKRFPGIHFTYRCHPTWVHPLNVGVNAINRVNDYFQYLNLPNLTLSANMPIASDGKTFKYSFSRSSFDEDLSNTDFVFGEHSISMIDAAFKKIPFCSINLTNRRNFFIGINDLGFPTCASYEEIYNMIKRVNSKDFINEYMVAIENYNMMTDKEE